ncbi:MAG: hypothetical protein M3174_03585 [Actinomycetota bacterium]|nr:hypothetical protein [Actinomycetota bacterium]
MTTIRKVLVISLALPLALAASASAGDFSPKMRFGLKPAKVNKNPELSIFVEQNQGEEELGHVVLQVPAGFKLPKDKQIEDGDKIGTADLEIASGPGCANAGPGTAPATFPMRDIYEQDRTDEQSDRGVKAVWVVDLRPVTTIPLEIKGSPRKGYKLEGDIPANQFTCPPLVFDATIFAKSTLGNVPIVKTPGTPGRYIFRGTFHSQDSPSVKTIRQAIRITR